MTVTLLNRIGSERLPAASGKTMEVRSPATGALVANAPLSGVADIDKAVAAARKAFQDWRAKPAPLRGEVLLRA
ncbi:MAG TPA: aldehyde dehydrogenase family protein, partial [Solirubrobacterales bacterium]|nr:aldehyde dehydrogenase family protein [Solirubrobacterales bacterium]